MDQDVKARQAARGHGSDYPSRMLIAFNKPFGVLCQFTGERPTLADYIDVPEVYPAGRLDKDSEGLLLLTDDGPLQARIASPKFKLPRAYRMLIEREPDGARAAAPSCGPQG